MPRGVSYNSYLLLDEKTVLFDGVDKSVLLLQRENVEHLLAGRPLDYLIVQHVEPDHAAAIGDLLDRHPGMELVLNEKSAAMLRQFLRRDLSARTRLVAEGDTLMTGAHTLTFVMAPMVHWPEVMVTYDSASGALFSADAFGTFGALSGNLFADEVDFERDWLPDARRYYANIVGKYGTQVQQLLKKASALDIRLICPLHGPVWRKNIAYFVDKYMKWSAYEPEEDAVMIAYASVYGNTETAAQILAGMLAERGQRRIALYDVSAVHPSYLVAEAFRCSHLVFASTTYNAGLFVTMETLLSDLKAHALKNRTVALIENGSWAPQAGQKMGEVFGYMQNIRILNNTVTVRSSLAETQLDELSALADAIVASMPQPAPIRHTPSTAVEPGALHRLSYGLFVLTAREGDKDNGCIINTAAQLTDDPKRISVAVNKKNYTHGMILRTGVFNVSILTEQTPMDVFRHFGFQSGAAVNKFAGCPEEHRAQNGVLYVPKYTNAFLSGRVVQTVEFETHTLFIAEVTEAQVLKNAPSVTYAYYFQHIKPAPQPAPAPAPASGKKRWVCKICGYVHEGDELPADFVCPWCKHGASDFEPVTEPAPEPKKTKWVCNICGYVYEGDELPADFVCPWCKHGASDFVRVE